MNQALLQKKLKGSFGETRFKPSEDSLTSSTIGLLQYLDGILFWEILRESCGEKHLLTQVVGKLNNIYFWRRFLPDLEINVSHVEPDVYCEFEEVNLIIEAKKGDAFGQNVNQWRKEINSYFKKVESDKPLLFIAIGGNNSLKIKEIELDIDGTSHVIYGGDLPAHLNLNGKNITNTQILVAGTTGSGKSNLLAVLINEIRGISVDTSYPVNFLLFDYKGEFSDPANNDWLGLFEVDRGAILDPIIFPLPFTPFKVFVGKPQNEINLYANELANALCAIDRATISANMSNRLAEAVINAYKRTHNQRVDFEIILKEYVHLLVGKDKEKDDSITSVLKQLIRTNLFAKEDKVDLINGSYIVKMDGFPKDGPIAKAIVYFIVSKLNNIYETLPKQVVNENYVQLRHFTIIDEAHYMLGFDNKPLRDLIAVGRNKGLSIILATQNMDHFKSEHFDFYANAQYPLIMKQQSINDGVIKDLFGVSGAEFQEIKQAIAGLQKGELMIKDPTAITLGMGKKYKKIMVSHLI